VYNNQPWAGYSVGTEDIRGVWRFYSARDSSWDTLETHTETGTSVRHSPTHPLQVYAYPIESGPTVSQNSSILEIYGGDTASPTLPPEIQLDTVEDSYLSSFGIATRSAERTPIHQLRGYGLVRGVNADAEPAGFLTLPINRSTISLAVVNTSTTTTTVRVSLRDQLTGEPIDTSTTDGFVVVENQRVNTTATGTALVTVPKSVGGISARYEPDHWWQTSPGYVGDSDVVYAEGVTVHIFSRLYQLVVPATLFLLAAVLVDRITGWRLWPPWRRR